MQTLSPAVPADALNGLRAAAVSATAPSPKKAGRERTCHQCGATYRSIRSTSLYCSAPCRKRAARGTAATGGPRADRSTWHPITKALLIAGYVGRTGPCSTRSTQTDTYALLVEPGAAHAELAHQFNRRGWGMVTREEFAEALKTDGVQGFTCRTPEAAENKRWKDRQRQRAARAC